MRTSSFSKPSLQPQIKVLLSDDHAMIRSSLRMVIERRTSFQIVGEASTSAETLELACSTQPDIILLDLDLDGESGLDIIPQLRSLVENARILVLTGSRNSEHHRIAVRLGAVGLVLKSEGVDVLLEAMERVASGNAWLDSGLVASVLTLLSRPSNTLANPEELRIATLTERERAVIALVGEGLQNKAIGDRLCISDTTVRHHLTSIFAKLELDSRLELVIFAYRNGLAQLPLQSKALGAAN